jgi:predicted HAD superfamily phosphohydrolase YqeG
MVSHMKISHGTLAAETVAQTCIVIGQEIHTDVMPYELGGIWVAAIKRNFTPAQRTTAIVVNGQR